MSHIKAFLNPRIAGGVRWWQIHAAVATSLLVAAVALIAFSAGWFSSSRYHDANYYAHTYRAPIHVPSLHVPVKIRATILPSSGSIHFTYFKTQINDQGQLGSCQSWAFVKQLSYAYNWNYPHHGRFYSPRFTYDAISQCADQGSYLEQYPPVVAAQGIPQWTQMPYGTAAEAMGLPDYVVDCPIGATYIQEAALHHLSLTEQPLYEYPGAGSGGLSLVLQAISTHHAVNLDFPVYPEYDQANADGSTVNPPTSGETDRGGHANTGVTFDNNHDNGDGTHGAVLSSNQWGKNAGVGSDGVRHTDGTPNGFVWLSYRFVEQYSFGVAVIHVSSTSTGAHQGHVSVPPPPAVDPSAPLHPAPVSGPMPPQPSAGAWYVHGVTATTGQDLSPLLNHWGDVYHVWPVGLAATLGVESALNPYAERWTGLHSLDNSCGLAQQIITNVAYYQGIQGARAECNWEEHPENSIYLEARIYAEYFAFQHNCVRWPQAYGMYNAGAGYPCSYYYNATGDVAAHLQVFYGWYSIALSRWAGGSPPPPPKRPGFPARKWRAHTRTVSQYDHGSHLRVEARLWWRGHVKSAGPVISAPQWFRPMRHRRIGFMTTRFADERLYWWPGHTWVKWIRVRHIGR